MRAAGADVKEIQTQLGHRFPMITLSIYTHLFEDAYDSVMDRLDTDHRDLVRPKSGKQRPSQASDPPVRRLILSAGVFGRPSIGAQKLESVRA